MKTYEEVQSAIKEAMPSEGQLNEAAAAAIAQSIQSQGTTAMGPGIHVRAILNTDEGGLNIRWRRPSCRQQWNFFVPCDVEKPARQAEESQPEKGEKGFKSSQSITDGDKTGSAVDDRALAFDAIVSQLNPEEGFTQDGSPSLPALNAKAKADGVEEFTSEERDTLWAARSGD